MGYDGSIKINTGIKKIEIEDAGEYIQFSTADSNFLGAFVDFYEWFRSQKAEFNKMSELAKSIDTEEEDKTVETIKDILATQNRLSSEACIKIDGMFGAGSCSKIFGENSPSILLIGSFIDGIMPYIEQSFEERKKKRSTEYNRSRKGANSNNV